MTPEMQEALALLNEAEARLNNLCGDWGHNASKRGSLIDRIRDFLVRHGVRPNDLASR